MNDPSENIGRILSLIPYVRENPGLPIQELARHFGCTPREIMVDLNRVLLCGVPPYLPDDYIGVYIENDCVEINFADHFARPIRLSLQEGLALKLAIENLPRGGHPALRRARASLLQKVSDLIRTRDMNARVTSTQDRAAGEGHFDILEDAILRSRKVAMEYYSLTSDEVRERIVRPFALAEGRGRSYLIAHDERHDKVLTFRADRIRSVRALQATFQVPPDFDLDAFLRERRERRFTPTDDAVWVRVRFSAESARYIREEFPADQIETTGDGIVLRFKVGSPSWLFRWVLQYGDEAEILEPGEYRQAFAAYLAEYVATNDVVPA